LGSAANMFDRVKLVEIQMGNLLKQLLIKVCRPALKAIIRIILLVLLLYPGVTYAAPDPIIVGGNRDYPPYEFIDKKRPAGRLHCRPD